MCRSGVEDLYLACVIHTGRRMMGFIFLDWHDSDDSDDSNACE